MAAPQTQPETNVLAQLLEPLEQYMTVELAQRIAALRATPEAQARIDELADKFFGDVIHYACGEAEAVAWAVSRMSATKSISSM